MQMIIRDMPDDLHRTLKAQAASEGMTMKDAVIEAVAAWVARTEMRNNQPHRAVGGDKDKGIVVLICYTVSAKNGGWMDGYAYETVTRLTREAVEGAKGRILQSCHDDKPGQLTDHIMFKSVAALEG